MLSVLGYDPKANPPDYGKPDSFVIHNMNEIALNKDDWAAKEREMMKVRESIRSSLVKQKNSNTKTKEDLDAGAGHQSSDADKTKVFDQGEST